MQYSVSLLSWLVILVESSKLYGFGKVWQQYRVLNCTPLGPSTIAKHNNSCRKQKSCRKGLVKKYWGSGGGQEQRGGGSSVFEVVQFSATH